MKYLMLTLILFLGACSTMPEILPDNTSDNVIMMQLKNDINQGGQLRPSYGWIFWYGPIAVLALMWGFRELIKKPIPKECIEKSGEIVIENESTAQPEIKQ